MYPTHIDSQAEREAEAIERLAELTGEPVPLTNLQRARFQAIEATERGLPKPRRWIYNKGAAVAAHIRMLERIARGDLTTPRVVLITRNQLDRKAQKRAVKQHLLTLLGHMPGSSQPVDLMTAVKLTGASKRVLSRAVHEGELSPLRSGQRVYFNPTDLRQYLARRLKPRQNRRIAAEA